MIPGEFLPSQEGNHEPPLRVLFTELYVPLIFAPIEPMTETRPTVIKPNITAYSVAVGPSSLVRKSRIREIVLGIWDSLVETTLGGTVGSANRLAATPAQIRIDSLCFNPSDCLPQPLRRSRARGAAHGAADRAERAADARAERADDCYDGHHDQGQHHRVLDSRWAVLAREEAFDATSDLGHWFFPVGEVLQSPVRQKVERLDVDIHAGSSGLRPIRIPSMRRECC